MAYGAILGQSGANRTLSNLSDVSASVYNSGTAPRKNLLDNWGFQVWQRYPNGNYNGVPNNSLIPDRFIITSSNGSQQSNIIQVSPYGIKNNSGPNCVLNQKLLNQEQYNGMTLTLTLWKNTGLLSETLTVSDWTDIDDIFNYFAKNSGNQDMRWIYQNETLYACKLEIGEDQTLVRKVGEEYVLLEQPVFIEELEKCKRYYQKSYIYTANQSTMNSSRYLNTCTAFVFSKSPVKFFNGRVTFSTNMSKTPTITIYNPENLTTGNAQFGVVDGGGIAQINVDDSYEKGFGYTITQSDNENNTCYFHYTADTGM